MLNEAFLHAIHIIDVIEKNGYEAYFVGGCVRDKLLNKEIEDIDIATSAPPHVITQLFDKVIPVGIEHGTVIVRWEGVSYEVTTFRKEGKYSDQRHPDEVIFVTDVTEDLKRRDFTMNALAMDRNGYIIDLFAGKQDLHHQLIRTVGNAKERFTEDPLRIIRALRFTSELGFQIEEQTLQEMINVAPAIETLAIERLLNEITKFFKGSYVSKGMYYLLQTNIKHYLPIIKDHVHVIEKFPNQSTAFVSFAEVITLFHYYDPSIPITTWTNAWKCSNKIKNKATNLNNAYSYFESHTLDLWLAYILHEYNYKAFIHLIAMIHGENVITLNDLQTLNNKLQIKSRNELAIDGNELLEWFAPAKPGKWMNDTFIRLEKEVVMNRIKNDKQSLKEWILCHPPEIN